MTFYDFQKALFLELYLIIKKYINIQRQGTERELWICESIFKISE